MNNLASFIDHTLLSPTTSETDIRKLCEEAWIYQVKAICVAPCYVTYVKEMMEFCPIKIEICTVIGFPFGYTTSMVKIKEAENALKNGATELDIVMNLSQFKSMAYISIKEELKQISEIAHAANAITKVIIETAYLDSFELYTACEIGVEANTDFIKTSTGFAPIGAELELVKKMRALLPPEVKIKAAGGIKTFEQAVAFIDAGAERIGTSSAKTILMIA